MPELPDVEVFRQYFEATSLRQTIGRVEVLDAAILDGVSPQQLRERVEDRRFDSGRRHGKYLFAHLGGDDWLAFHFGMTGYLRYFREKEEAAPKYTRLTFHFSGGYALAYSSLRKLGKIAVAENPDGFIKDRGLGPDYLGGADLKAFREGLQNSRSSLKSALMNQGLFAGIGNIYSDEVLFQARVHPETAAGRLDEETVRRLFQSINEVMRMAIDRDAEPERMPESYLLPHRQKGGRCPVCGGEVKAVKISGRTAYYCPRCQR